MSIRPPASASSVAKGVSKKTQREVHTKTDISTLVHCFVISLPAWTESHPHLLKTVQFLCLRDRYKSNLLDDSRLTKAAGLAAQKELLLESPAPDTWKEPRLKSVNRELRQRVKKIRQPGGGGGCEG